MREVSSISRGRHRGEADNIEATKAAAWAVFQHHGGSAGLNRAQALPLRRVSRFKIEAQMKHVIEHRTVSGDGFSSWDAGSTLFDSFELDSLFKQLGHACQSSEPRISSSIDDETEDEGATGAPSHNHFKPHPLPRPRPPAGAQRRHGRYGPQYQQYAENGRFFEGAGPGLDSVDEVHPLALQGRRSFAQEGEDGSFQDARSTFHDDHHIHGTEYVHGKVLNVFHHLHTPHRFNMVKDKRRSSFDQSLKDEPTKAARRSFGWKLRHIFHRSTQDVAGSFLQSHARIAPHDSHQKELRIWGHKSDHESGHHGHNYSEQDRVHRRSYTSQSDDALSSDSGRDDPIALDVHNPCDKHDHLHDDHHSHNLLPHALKSGLRMVLPRPFCRSLHLRGQKYDSDLEDSPCDCRKHIRNRKQDPPPAWPEPRRPLSFLYEPEQHQHDPRHLEDCQHGEHADLDGRHEDEDEYHHEYHHHYHHHHHHQEEQEDFELTVQAIVKRVPRKSFEEKVHGLSMEDNGMRVPRNSLEFFEDRARRSSLDADSRMSSG